MNYPFRWTDAWLFEAVARVAGGARAPLASVLLSADGLNHQGMSFEELNGGVSRMERAGFLCIESDGALSLTAAGHELLGRARGMTRNEDRLPWTAVERLLGATPDTMADDAAAAGDGRELVDRGTWQAAQKAVKREVRESWRRAVAGVANDEGAG